MQRCKICGLEKNFSEFSKGATRTGYRFKCKTCWAEYMREYYKDKPDKYLKHKGFVQRNDKEYKRQWARHGLTEEEFKIILNKFDGLCWACKKENATCIDHDHLCCPTTWSCGSCVRGVLCNGCNSALGHIKDRVDRLENLVVYLKTTTTQVRTV